jgi:16S rRNA (uracil1498-N3)-methyltransferase
MHRFYIPPADWNTDNLALGAGEARHCAEVLRLKEGDRVTVFDGRGAEATAEIVSAAKDRVSLKCLHTSRTPSLQCAITLAQAVPKGKNMDLIIQKATELGAAEIVPLLSERTVVQLDDADAVKKQEKWQETAIEACKQCGRNQVPEVQKPVTPRKYFAAPGRFDLTLIASLQPDARHLKEILAEYKEAGNDAKPQSVLILVGPEGDFTPAEIALAKSSGCRPITLGPIILRTETAAIYCLSVLGHELLS